jgi:tetratricopeptide (TPR) repeat protein
MHMPPVGRIGARAKIGTAGEKMRRTALAIGVLIDVAGAAALSRVSAAELPVRFGSHPTFDRMVFDWREPTEYRVDLKSGSAIVVFDRTAEIDRKAMDAGLAKLSSRAEVEQDGQKLILKLTLPDQMQLRHFRSGTKVVLDFTRGAEPAKPAELRPDAPTKSGGKIVTPPAADTSAKREPEPMVAAPAAQPSQAAQTAPAPRKPIPLRARPETLEAAKRPDAPAVATSAATTPTAPTASTASTAQIAPAAPVIVDLVRTPDGQGLRFAWKEPVGAAVFGRGQYLWIVFDRRASLVLMSLRGKEDVLGSVEVIEPVGQSQGTALRLMPPAGTASAARREGDSWVIDIGRLPRAPDVPSAITVRNGGDPELARLLIEMSGARSILYVRDPEVGDEIAVAPTSAAGAGVQFERIYPQFRVLPTAQGAAIQKVADTVAVRPAGSAVEISSPRGLYVSELREQTGRGLRALRAPILFDLAGWRRNGLRHFNEDRQTLHRTVADAAPDKRNAARLELARFLFAYGHMEDVTGLVELIEQEEPNLVATAQIKAMRGVAALMSGDLENARRNLLDKSLDAQPEAALWRGALAMAQGDAAVARAQMGRSVDLYRTYPAPFANRLNLWHAEARLLTDDLPGAESHLDAVIAGQPSLSERGQAMYLRGRMLLAAGDREAALATWGELENTPPTPGRTAAMLERTALMVEDGKLKPADAIPVLERLRFSWRGDSLEFAIMAQLGRLQIGTRDHRAGLTMLRNALALYPEHRDARKVREEMMQAFAAVFSGKETNVGAIATIALHDEFRELIPAGEAGDAIAEGLVDRLIAVDLLDRAGEVLEGLVKERLKGEAKARAGIRLAMVRLLNRKPEMALAALKASEVAGLDKDLARERGRLQGRARAHNRRLDEATNRLAADDSREADLLRAELTWRAEDWNGAATALTRLIIPTAGDLADEQARQAVRLAVALSLSRDKDGLKRFDGEFGAAMRKGPYKDIYQVVASDAAAQVGDLRDIAARAAAIAPFHSFLADYRKRLLSGAAKPSS